MRILSAEEARAQDAKTIAAGTPGLVLMKRAAAGVAREVARAIARRPERAGRVVVLAGPGNNGGDGFEAARLLMGSRVAAGVETLLVGTTRHLAGDALKTFERLTKSGGSIREVESEKDLEPLRSATLVVDALFGTGLKNPIAEGGRAARAVALASEGPAFVVAVDLPSGLSADDAGIWRPSVTADVTVTFGSPKRCHAFAPAAGSCGRITVEDIGLIPDRAAPADGEPEAVTARDLVRLFPRREAASHKGTYGHLLVVGGSEGMAGAPALAARAALRSGAGLATVASPEAVRPVVHTLSPESTTASLEADPGAFDALAVGPGLGRSGAASAAWRRMVSAGRPAVFDADALNLAARPEEFAGRSAPTILTPHPGEAGRLLGMDAIAVNGDRIAAAKTLAARSGCVVVLKGFRSVVASPEGRVALVLAGNAGMATGGAGDVLTGIAGSLLARGFSAFDAASAAAWLHGAAGDLAREGCGEESLVAGDLAAWLPEAFALVREARPA
jgi:NAD(P)H-hydrate epimerase